MSQPRRHLADPEITSRRSSEQTTRTPAALRTPAGLATSTAALLACAAALAASLLDPHAASHALGIDWPPFVLVAGLLLVGYVADREGVFRAAGNLLAWAPVGDRAFVVVSLLGSGLVSALFNLDTAAAFVTPVMAHAASLRSSAHGTARPSMGGAPERSMGGADERSTSGIAEGSRSCAVSQNTGGTARQGMPVYACLLGANAGSMLLPGSNLTNLIVLGPLHLSAGTFATRMAPAWAVALVVSGAILLLASGKRAKRAGSASPARPRLSERPGSPAPGLLGLLAMAAALACLLLAPSPAAPVAAVGVVALAIHGLRSRRALSKDSTTDATEHTYEAEGRRRIGLFELMDPRVLVGLFAVAVALGTLGGDWSGPSRLLGHLGTYATAALGAAASLVVNNLPAASLLSAGQVAHPYALLVGLNIGPDIFLTGSLSWVIWLKAAHLAGEAPSIRRASLLGLATVPPALLLAMWALGLGTARP